MSVSNDALSQLAERETLMPAFFAGATILFQGDSITDGNRGRNLDPNHILGHGYAFIISARFGARFPERALTFYNRGVSGNKVTDLQARWTTDTLDLKPDYLSILIGINDTGSGVDVFEESYDALLTETVQSLPQTRLILCAPFRLPGNEDIQARQVIVAWLAEKHHAAFVNFQPIFDEASEHAPAKYWVWDGVHPTYAGHQLMADEWVRVVDAYWTNGK